MRRAAEKEYVKGLTQIELETYLQLQKKAT